MGWKSRPWSRNEGRYRDGLKSDGPGDPDVARSHQDSNHGESSNAGIDDALLSPQRTTSDFGNGPSHRRTECPYASTRHFPRLRTGWTRPKVGRSSRSSERPLSTDAACGQRLTKPPSRLPSGRETTIARAGPREAPAPRPAVTDRRLPPGGARAARGCPSEEPRHRSPRPWQPAAGYRRCTAGRSR